MPELPEVETIATQLNQKVSGLGIQEVQILFAGSFIGDKKTIIGKKVQAVSRKAKNLIIKFDEDLNLLIHLKMTGQLIYVDSDKRIAGGHPTHEFHEKLPNKHTRVIFSFDNGSKLYFNDMRKFGWCRVLNAEELGVYFSSFGPDANTNIDARYLSERAARMPKSSIKKFLLDQNVIAGIGNIYTDEMLFDLRIHPETLVSKITLSEWQEITKEAKTKLDFAISKGGTTDSDYVNAYGEKGGMQDYLNVYHKAGLPCPRDCGGVVTKIRVAGRGTHFCPVCQKVKK